MDKVDMSLDDIIKLQRKQSRKTRVAAKIGAAIKKKPAPVNNKQALQKKPFKNKQTSLNPKRSTPRPQPGRLNLKPKPQSGLQQRRLQNQQRGAPGAPAARLNVARAGGANVKQNVKMSVQQQKAQRLQQRIDQRRRLQQNRLKVNRPGSVSSNQSTISDAKLLKLAKALLLKKTGANLFNSPGQNVAYSARQLGQQQRRAVQQTQNVQRTQQNVQRTQQNVQRTQQNVQRTQQNVQRTLPISPSRRQKRRWNRLANADPNRPDSLITVSVKNELANTRAERRRLNRSGPASDLAVRAANDVTPSFAPQAQRQRSPVKPPVSDIIRGMKPSVEMNYDFSKEVFSSGKTGVGLSQRFSSGKGPAPRPQAQRGPPGARQIYL